jgi:ribosome biogenesis GTPase
LIIRTQSGFFTVETAAGEIVCTLRGKLKQERARGPAGALATGSDPGRRARARVVEGIDVRQRYIPARHPSQKANTNRSSSLTPIRPYLICLRPSRPKFRMLDRFLVSAEKQATPAAIVANKIDLIGLEHAQALFGHYGKLGYPLIYTSVKTGQESTIAFQLCAEDLRHGWSLRGRQIQSAERTSSWSGPGRERDQPGDREGTAHDRGFELFRLPEAATSPTRLG